MRQQHTHTRLRVVFHRFARQKVLNEAHLTAPHIRCHRPAVTREFQRAAHRKRIPIRFRIGIGIAQIAISIGFEAEHEATGFLVQERRVDRAPRRPPAQLTERDQVEFVLFITGLTAVTVRTRGGQRCTGFETANRRSPRKARLPVAIRPPFQAEPCALRQRADGR